MRSRSFMQHFLLAIALGAGLAQSGMSQNNITNEAARLEQKGEFKEASALLKGAIDSKKYSAGDQRAMALQLDLMARVKQDYTTTEEQLFDSLQQEIKNLTQKELDGWVKDGWFDARMIDGKLLFFDSSVDNLWYRHQELASRRLHPPNKTAREKKALEVVEAIKKAAIAEKTPYVLPKKFQVTMQVAANADVVPEGKILRAWVPIPRHYPFQDNFKLLSSSWPPTSVNPADSAIRAVYFEEPAKKNKKTEFNIEYEYTARGVYFDLKPDQIKAYDPNDKAVKDYTGESPHVSFTPEIRALSAKIVGDEKNPMLKAKKIFDYLSDSLLYSYATEYSTVPNISEFCRSRGYGDCGEQGMLFITLCRYNGVPARWQSGWNLFPGDISNHDWAEIYLAPYGWVPVDQYMGNYAMRYIKSLPPAQKQEIRDFYFGGLDQYRMIANSDHSVALSPAKESFRSDDVDFQRGEIECEGKNLYFGQFSYSLHYKEMASPVLP